jgi:hypothetical protein
MYQRGKIDAKGVRMEWVQFIIFFIGVFGLFIWNRTESRTDMRRMDDILKAQRDLIWEIRVEGINFHNAIRDEMKDFHRQLLDIQRK